MKNIKFTCVHCANHIECSDEYENEVVTCPHCAKQTVLRQTPAPPSPPAAATPVPPTPGPSPLAILLPETPKQYLARIRSQSSYLTLRHFITLICGLMGLAGVLSYVMVFFGSYFAAIQKDYVSSFPVMISCFIIGSLIICLAIAIRQASFVVIDLADMQIEANRRKQVITILPH